MEIQILDGIDGAKQARGLTVIIDVFRAFTVACYAFDGGVQRIIPVASLADAFHLKSNYPSYRLVGERGGIMPEGFDFGNSPYHIHLANLTGETLIHTTSAGTQGIANAKLATEILTGAFVNAQAIASYIRIKNPTHVSLVAMGWGGTEPTDEDTLCAHYIRDLVMGNETDFEAIRHQLTYHSSTTNFLDVSDKVSAPVEDFDLCLQGNRFPFVCKVSQSEEFGLVIQQEKSI
jgi:2-phosphosulfolactate phosphatase